MPEKIGHTYPGSKHQDGTFHTIINHIRPHDVYIEPFCGSGAVMLRKRPAAHTYACELGDQQYARLMRHPDYQPFRKCILHEDGVNYIQKHPYSWTARTCIYADPPFVMGSRVSQQHIYEHEWSDMDHIKFLSVMIWLDHLSMQLSAVSGRIDLLISGYHSDMYMEKLEGWHHISYNTRTRKGNVKEYLWMNYDPTKITELHDYRYLGCDFRERENLTRQQRRWISRLSKMPILQRKAMIDKINQSFN